MILLAIIYFALAALGLGLIVYGDLVFWPRLVLVVTIPAVAFLVWQAAQPPTGWPSSSSPSKTAQFQWAVIREPDQLSRDRGEIDLWMIPPGSNRPRAYRLPYTRQLHRQAQAAENAVRGGGRVGVRKVALRRSAHGGSRSRYVFFLLPPPMPPAKD